MALTMQGCTSELMQPGACWHHCCRGCGCGYGHLLSGMSCHTQCSLTGGEMILGNKYFHFESHLSAKAHVGNSIACKSDKCNLTCAAQYWENIWDVAVAMWQGLTWLQTLTKNFHLSSLVSSATVKSMKQFSCLTIKFSFLISWSWDTLKHPKAFNHSYLATVSCKGLTDDILYGVYCRSLLCFECEFLPIQFQYIVQMLPDLIQSKVIQSTAIQANPTKSTDPFTAHYVT